MNDELRKLKELKAYRLENEKYRYYTPIGKVGEFIDAFGSGKYFICFISAANGVGKTRAGVNILAHLMYPCGNPYFQAPLFKDWPFLKRGRIISEPTTVKSTTIREIKDQFPRGRYGVTKYSTTKDGKQFEASWKTNTGWEFDIMTYEQQVTEFESATLGWVWFDEPPPLDIYKATVSRMRKGGVIFITATPLTGSAWMYDQFYAPERKLADNVFAMTAEMEDACIEHGERGFLRHQDIVNIISQYDDEDMQARVFGKFQHLTGLIFKKFSRKIHVIEPFAINEKDFVVINAIDPHPRNPDAVMWVAVDRWGRKFIIDEMYDHFRRKELVAKIQKRELGWRVIKRIIDPSAFVVDQHTGDSLAAFLSRNGLSYDEGSKKRSESIRRTKDALDYHMVGNEIITAPELYVFSHCTRTIWEFEHWQWENWTGKTADSKSQKEKPQDKDDHMMEDIGRILLENVEFTEKPEERLVPSMHASGSLGLDDPYA
jgi:phage terminase large subunit-like protein